VIELFRNPGYDFIGKRRWTYAFSGVIVLASLLSLLLQGLRYDIDFTGGVLMQVRFQRAVTTPEIRAALATIGLGEGIIQEFGGPDEYIVRLPLTGTTVEASEEVRRRVEAALAARPSLGASEIRRVEFVGPQVGRDLQQQALYAVLLGLGGILLYVALRFDLKGAVAAVIAVFHDIVVCLGALSLTYREFSLPVLAALLTIIGYQVNDTIVAYDRLRENRAKGVPRDRPFAEQMNDAVNQTLSRTVLTALTVVMSAGVIFVLGGKTLEDFAFVLLLGSLIGTYSTVFVAGALVVDWTMSVEGRWRRTGRPLGAAGRNPRRADGQALGRGRRDDGPRAR
jgi:preprotein translocase subunit SecF